MRCTQDNCDYECKSNSHFKRHLWQVHNIGDGKIFKCTQDNCDYECKSNSHFKRHLWQVHNIGDGKIFKCTQDNCDYECKSNSHFKRHLWQVHNIGDGKIFKCTQDNCDYESKSNSHFKRHLSTVHDIGDYECSICAKMVFKLLPDYINPKVTTKNDIIKNSCRNCYKKITGYNSRIEKDMVESLEQNETIKEYIMLKDKIIKGSDCNTKRRPDLMIGSTQELIIILECDEHQHSGYNSLCEMGRMDEIFDELKDTRTIFIRWNPDNYKITGNYNKKKKDERLNELKNLILKLINKKNWENDYTMVFYMYYNNDNIAITNRHSYTLLY